ncbi:MAG: hypothetical protein NTX82_03775 [Candidatus Parcubacteria bacterium]|nr:hypothetical protein [Candidatus Parcubacteria bacterium]
MKMVKLVWAGIKALLGYNQEKQKRLSIAEMLASYDLTGKKICLKNAREKGEDLVGFVNFICIISEMLIIQVKQGYFWHPDWEIADEDGPRCEYIEGIQAFNYDPNSFVVILEDFHTVNLELFTMKYLEEDGMFRGKAPIIISL